MPRRDPLTPDLFDWQPPQVAVSLPPEATRGGTLRSQIARAVAQALKDCGQSREEVAEAMSVYLDQPVSKNMLDAYASPSREEHRITLERFIALTEATGHMGLLGFIADHFGHVVVPKKYNILIEMQMVKERQEALNAREQVLLASWRSSR